MTRREFGGWVAGAGAGLATAADKGAVPPKVRAFPLTDVRLLDGPWKRAMERNRAFLLDLETDRMLHSFRLTAGLATSATPLGGWERPTCEVRGHFEGHYLSACALMYSATGDARVKARGEEMVAGMARCQKAMGTGYLSAFPTELLDRLRDGKKVWAPWYTLHKILAGMLDMHAHCGSRQALEVAQGMAEWTGKWAAPLTREHLQRTLDVEQGGLAETLLILYATTGETRWLKLARRFEHEKFLAPLAARRDELTGLHANTNIPKVVAAARAYQLTGEPRYRTMAEFFWEQVALHRSYVTGGTSNHEFWRTPPDRLAAELSNATEECCCTYNMLRLTRRIFEWNPDPALADFAERALWNGILGTMSEENAMTMYFVPLAPGYWRRFSSPRDSFWCCTGSGLESFSKAADGFYWHDASGLYVTQFVASELSWDAKGLRLRQETRFPESDTTAYLIQAAKPVPMDLRVRVPWWATRGVTATVNGKPVRVSAAPSSYLTLSQMWRSGDRVEVRMPMSLSAHAMPDAPSSQAFLYGPVVLAGELGSEGLTRDMIYAKEGNGYKGDPVAVPELAAASAGLESWIVPEGDAPLRFRTRGQSQDVSLIPFHRLQGQRYAVYWKVRRA